MKKYKIDNSLWPTSMKQYPRVYIQEATESSLKISIFPCTGVSGYAFELPKCVCRMLARRLNQCLDNCERKR